MKRIWVWLLWVCAAGAFAADDPAALQARIDAARAKLDAAAKELAALYRQDTFNVVVPRPGTQVSLGALLMPRGPGGVNVAGVTPDGPADRAGIVAGDVLVAIDGAPLDAPADKPPIARLFDALGAVAPGDTVRIDFLRDGERLTADVIADPPLPAPHTFTAIGAVPAGDVAFGAVAASGPVDTMAFVGRPGGPAGVAARAMIGGLELFDLNADLGHYFGVDAGVLVLRAPPDAGLVAGDVLRAINGAAVNGVAQCIESLGRASGAMSVEVLRDGAVQIVPFAPPPAPVLLPPPPLPTTQEQ